MFIAAGKSEVFADRFTALDACDSREKRKAELEAAEERRASAEGRIVKRMDLYSDQTAR